MRRRTMLGGMASSAGLPLASPAYAQREARATSSPGGPKPRIAVFSGPTATIQNSPPLVTANPAHDPSFQSLRAQRLAAPVVVYVEQFSGHPLERDARQLYGPPDGWIVDGAFTEMEPASGAGVPVHRIELKPSDGLYLLPYVSRRRDREPWEGAGTAPDAPASQTRQTFYPDAHRVYEEIDRFAIGRDGYGNVLSKQAEFDFFRAAPSGGYVSGLSADARTDFGTGDAPAERWGRDFFPYSPRHLRAEPEGAHLAVVTNLLQRTLARGGYAGAQWLEGSPTVEETLYWLNLLIDTDVPIVGHSAQRAHGLIGCDGDRNILDGVEYILSRVWADERGRDRLGAVLIVDEVVFAAREVAKTDARPGGYAPTGGHGGVVASLGGKGPPLLSYVPVRLHTHKSELRLPLLPGRVPGVRRVGPGRGAPTAPTTIVTKDLSGLRPDAMPYVSMASYVRWPRPAAGSGEEDAAILEQLDLNLRTAPLSGFVAEGASPSGRMNPATDRALTTAVFSGVPVVRCGRGNTAGYALAEDPYSVSAHNLTATKARLLLMACLLKLGALPPAVDPRRPTASERAATREKIAAYQALFESH